VPASWRARNRRDPLVSGKLHRFRCGKLAAAGSSAIYEIADGLAGKAVSSPISGLLRTLKILLDTLHFGAKSGFHHLGTPLAASYPAHVRSVHSQLAGNSAIQSAI
jgi:hypothetical protein